MHPIKRQMNSTHARVKVSHVPILFSMRRAFCLLDETKVEEACGISGPIRNRVVAFLLGHENENVRSLKEPR